MVRRSIAPVDWGHGVVFLRRDGRVIPCKGTGCGLCQTDRALKRAYHAMEIRQDIEAETGEPEPFFK